MIEECTVESPKRPAGWAARAAAKTAVTATLVSVGVYLGLALVLSVVALVLPNTGSADYIDERCNNYGWFALC